MDKRTTYATKLQETSRNLRMLRDRQKRTGEILVQIHQSLQDMSYHAATLELTASEKPEIIPWLDEFEARLAGVYKKSLETEATLDTLAKELTREDRLGKFSERRLSNDEDVAKTLVEMGYKFPSLQASIGPILAHLEKKF